MTLIRVVVIIDMTTRAKFRHRDHDPSKSLQRSHSFRHSSGERRRASSEAKRVYEDLRGRSSDERNEQKESLRPRDTRRPRSVEVRRESSFKERRKDRDVDQSRRHHRYDDASKVQAPRPRSTRSERYDGDDRSDSRRVDRPKTARDAPVYHDRTIGDGLTSGGDAHRYSDSHERRNSALRREASFDSFSLRHRLIGDARF